MSLNGCNRGIVAATAVGLALLAPMLHGGDAIAQHPAPERQSIGRPASNGIADHASGDASRASATDDGMADTSTALPGALSETPGERQRRARDTTRACVLRSVSDPSQAEANDVYFLGLAVAIYLACLLVADHLNASGNRDDVGARGRGDAPDRARGGAGKPG
ncbi:MAG: hypothetical protein IPF60_15600 [Betaproteobacteria bacterium]|nr:hypothetical protein [Betaproteobacteria bacterium]